MTTLRAAVDEYLAMRRNLGFRLCATGRLLHQFVAFMEHQRAGIITTQLAMAWAQQSQTVQPAEWARRLSIVRIFARHRHATDPRTEIPPAGLLPYRPKRARPYVYSDEEIRRLVRAARTMSYHYERGALRPWVYSCLLGLLSVSGMRLGDARNLELPDIDLPAGVLTIRGAKFGKTRLVPLHPSVCTVLADYLRRRHQHWKNRWCPRMCSCRARGIAWMWATFIAPFMCYLGRSVCAAPPIVVAHAFMTYDIGSP